MARWFGAKKNTDEEATKALTCFATLVLVNPGIAGTVLFRGFSFNRVRARRPTFDYEFGFAKAPADMVFYDGPTMREIVRMTASQSHGVADFNEFDFGERV